MFPNVVSDKCGLEWGAEDFQEFFPQSVFHLADKVNTGTLSETEKQTLEGALCQLTDDYYERLYLTVSRFETPPSKTIVGNAFSQFKNDHNQLAYICTWGSHYSFFQEEVFSGYGDATEESRNVARQIYQQEKQRASLPCKYK
jgi:hypothetical protein